MCYVMCVGVIDVYILGERLCVGSVGLPGNYGGSRVTSFQDIDMPLPSMTL